MSLFLTRKVQDVIANEKENTKKKPQSIIDELNNPAHIVVQEKKKKHEKKKESKGIEQLIDRKQISSISQNKIKESNPKESESVISIDDSQGKAMHLEQVQDHINDNLIQNQTKKMIDTEQTQDETKVQDENLKSDTLFGPVVVKLDEESDSKIKKVDCTLDNDVNEINKNIIQETNDQLDIDNFEIKIEINDNVTSNKDEVILCITENSSLNSTVKYLDDVEKKEMTEAVIFIDPSSTEEPKGTSQYPYRSLSEIPFGSLEAPDLRLIFMSDYKTGDTIYIDNFEKVTVSSGSRPCKVKAHVHFKNSRKVTVQDLMWKGSVHSEHNVKLNIRNSFVHELNCSKE